MQRFPSPLSAALSFLAPTALTRAPVRRSVFRKAFLRWRKQEAQKLVFGSNAITRGWDRVGLRGALNPRCAGWSEAIRAFGAHSLLGAAYDELQRAVEVVGRGGDAAASEAMAGEAASGEAAAGKAGGKAAGGTAAGGKAVGGTAAVGEEAAEAARASALLRRQEGDRLVARLVAVARGKAARLDLRDAAKREPPAVGMGCREPPEEPLVTAVARLHGASGCVQVLPLGGKEQRDVELRLLQLQDPADEAVLLLRSAYVCADEQRVDGRASKLTAKQKRERAELQKLAEQHDARKEYEAEIEASKAELLKAARSGDDAAYDAAFGRTRSLLEKRPGRWVNGKWVTDSVALVLPELLSGFVGTCLAECLAKRVESTKAEPAAKVKQSSKGMQQNSKSGGSLSYLIGVRKAAEERKDAKKAAEAKVKVEVRKTKAAARGAKEEAQAQAKAAKQAAAASKKAQRADAERVAERARLKAEGPKALKELAWSSWERLSRRRRSILVRWYGGDAAASVPKQPPADGSMDGQLEVLWSRHGSSEEELAEMREARPRLPMRSTCPHPREERASDMVAARRRAVHV